MFTLTARCWGSGSSRFPIPMVVGSKIPLRSLPVTLEERAGLIFDWYRSRVQLGLPAGLGRTTKQQAKFHPLRVIPDQASSVEPKRLAIRGVRSNFRCTPTGL